MSLVDTVTYWSCPALFIIMGIVGAPVLRRWVDRKLKELS